MHSRDKKRRTVTRRPYQFTLESLTPRQLLSAAVDWLNVMGPTEAPSASRFITAENYGSQFAGDVANGYGLPAIVQVNNEGPFVPLEHTAKPNGHPVWCMCPSCLNSGSDDAGSLDASNAAADDTVAGKDFFDLAEAQARQTTILYLEFEGATVYSRPGDFWLGSVSVTTPAYDLSKFGWGGREAESIAHIVEFVREDYAPYNVVVTTEQPTGGEYTTIYVGGTNEWFRAGSGVIGVATYDVGNRNASNYGFAFSEELGIYAHYAGGDLMRFSEYLANLISHEAAHTFGANHVSDPTALMNPYLPLTPRRSMFGVGNIPGTDIKQDTQALLAANLGYRGPADDFPDGVDTARIVDVSREVRGILERRDDVDAMRFTASASGLTTVSLATSVYGNLEASLEVYSYAEGRIIAADAGLPGNEIELNFAVTAGASYGILISSVEGESSGTYTVAVAAPTGAPRLLLTDSVGSSSDRAMDFGTVTDTASGTLTLQNRGTRPLEILRLTSTGPFRLDTIVSAGNPADNVTLAPGARLTVNVALATANYGAHSGRVLIDTNDPANAAVTVSLSAYIPRPQADISLDATALDFGRVDVGATATQTLTVANAGTAPLTVSGLGVSAPFSFVAGFDGSAIVLEPGQQRTLTVAVTPENRTLFEGRLTIISDDPDEAVVSVPVTVLGVAGELTINENAQRANDNDIVFAPIYVGETRTETVTLTNTGNAAITLTEITTSGVFEADSSINPANERSWRTLDPGQSLEILVGFRAEGPGSFEGLLTVGAVGQDTATVRLAGEVRQGAIEIVELDGLDDGRMELGPVAIGVEAPLPVYRVTNHSANYVTVRMALAGGRALAVGDEVITVAPGGSETLWVRVTTDRAVPVDDVLTVTASGAGTITQTLELNADVYALVTARQSYSFRDQDGDRVRVVVTGGAAEVRLGAGGEADIASIRFTENSAHMSLMVLNSTGSIGDISGAVNLNTVNLAGATLTGAMTIDGRVGLVQTAGLGAAAQMRFATDSSGAVLRLGTVADGAEVDIAGRVRLLLAERLGAGVMQAERIGMMVVNNGFAMECNVTGGDLEQLLVRRGDVSGALNVQGRIGSVTMLDGHLTGTVNAGRDIDRILLLKGDLSGRVASAGRIGQVLATNLRDGELAASKGIDFVQVRHDMANAAISVGGAAASSQGAAADSAAYLGHLHVGGTFAASTVAVGVAAEQQGDFLNATAISGSGSVGMVMLNDVATENNHQPFGILTRSGIDSLRINNQVIRGLYQEGDFFVRTLG